MRSKFEKYGIGKALLCVTALFFVWGFVSSNNDPLIVILRTAFGLSYSDALMVQQVSFLANGLVSLPAASLGNRLGAVRTIMVALGVMIAGCLLVRLSINLESFPAILSALFVLAVGITVLQVAANPLAAALGPQSSSHFRLNFAQSFNSLGVVVGVHYGASIMLGSRANVEHRGAQSTAGDQSEMLATVSHAYLTMAAMLALLALFFWSQRHRIIAAGGPMRAQNASVLAAMQSRWALFGAATIGLYVGAEVSIGSVMINFLNRSDSLGVNFEEGGRFLANYYWGGALAGRIIGSILLTRLAAPRLLMFSSMAAAGLCIIVATGNGPLAGYAALAVGLFNSIMFPTIFSITLERSGASKNSTSGLLSLAILVGVILPLGVGWVADNVGLHLAFLLPAMAYLFITFFATKANSAIAQRPRPVG